METATTTKDSIEAPKAVATEDLKSAWERLRPRIPDGCEMTLYFEGHYGLHQLTSAKDPWEYVGAKWKVNLSKDGKLRSEKMYAGGSGDTPDDAMTAAVSDLYSKQRHADARELSEFREWRAARDRTGKYTPHSQEEWNEAVSAPSEDDEDEDL